MLLALSFFGYPKNIGKCFNFGISRLAVLIDIMDNKIINQRTRINRNKYDKQFI